MSPCDVSCASEPQELQCGQNGITYYNSCYRICANKQVIIIILFTLIIEVYWFFSFFFSDLMMVWMSVQVITIYSLVSKVKALKNLTT